MDSAFGAMDNPEALITYGMAGEALSAIQGEIIKSKDIYHLLITSQILRATGDLDGALLSSRKALDIDPFNESHILNQVVNLAFNGDSMELEAYSKALSDRLHESSELQAYLRKIIAVHGILRETTFSSSSKEAGKSVQPYYVYADTNVVLKAPVRVGFNEMPRIKRNSAIYDPSTRCWYEYETGMLVGDLLQASWNAEGFAFGAVPRRQLSHQELNDLKAASIVVDGTATFMPVINHFGHFITQCSPYLSFLGWMDCGSVQSLIIDNSLPSYADELLAMHPSTQNMNIVNPGTSPVYCENLVYSSQMWHEWHYSSSNAFRFLEDVSSIILETSRIEPPARIYVSRSRVKAGLRASVNEEDLESRLKTKGFHAIHLKS